MNKKSLSSIINWISGDIAIDLGTANTLIWLKGKGVVINEPSIVARTIHDDNIVAVGDEAKAMLGRTHRDLETIRPLQDGVIADFKMTDGMLQGFINKINFSRMARPRMVICVPSGVTEVERRAVKDSGERANAREVYLIEEPVAAAIGIGLDISQPIGNIIVDIGGGTTEIAVISLNGVVTKETIRIAGDEMDEATELFAKIINADSKEIIIGGSTSINLYVLSNALKYSIKPGDEVIVTNQDHEANISPWRRLAEVGAVIKEWKINKNTAELEIEEFKKLLSDKTKIIAVTHCSNIVGSVNDLKEISKLGHEKGAIVIGDGVSYAPHGFPNIKDLGVDFYTFSLYKTYGPHIALMYGKKEILKNLPNQNHQFLEGNYPYTINPGGPSTLDNFTFKTLYLTPL